MAAPAEEEEEEVAEPDEKALKRLEELVSELLRLREEHPAPPEPRNGAETDPLEEEMEKTLKMMEEVEVSPQARGRALVLRARALGACAAGSSRAEEALSRAVKLEPALAAAWTRLGELRWHRGDLEGARACFAGALQHGEDAEARRLLSMVLRAGAAPGGSTGPLRQSLAQAEAAVRCDPRDGRSWYVLGNAYVALFFAVGQSPDLARRALAAYAQAERVDPEAAKNPDLHLNRATLLQYEERWAQALEGFAAASALAPQWPEPQKRREELLDFLDRLCQGLRAAPPGRCRPPRAPPGSAPCPISSLRLGPNPHRLLVGRVVCCLRPEGGVPLALGLRDASGSAVAVTVYNAAPGWGAAIGDSLSVSDPLLSQHLIEHQGQSFSFSSVRVPSPLSLLLNGRRPPPPALAPTTLALSAPPEP